MKMQNRWGRIAQLATIVFLALLSASGCSKKSRVGESCEKPSDCASDLRCIGFKCAPRAAAGEECKKADDCAGSLRCLDRTCVDVEVKPDLNAFLGACWEFSDPRDTTGSHHVRFARTDEEQWQMLYGTSRSVFRDDYLRSDVRVTDEDGSLVVHIEPHPGQPATAATFSVRPLDYATVEVDKRFRRKMYGWETGGSIQLSRIACPKAGW